MIPSTSPGSHTSAAAGTVLYVDDEPANVQLVQVILAQRPQVRVLVAMRGETGLELARAHRPDLALLDLHLPDMSGHDVLARLRADPRTATVRVVVMSADTTPGLVERVRLGGADGFLAKPFDIAELLGIVDDATVLSSPAAGSTPAVTEDDGPLDAVIVAGLQRLHASEPAEVRNAVSTFLAHTGRRLDELRRAVEENERGRISDLAHAVAGTSAMYGATILAQRCHAIRGGAHADDLAAIRAQVQQVDQAFREARAALEVTFLADEPPSS